MNKIMRRIFFSFLALSIFLTGGAVLKAAATADLVPIDHSATCATLEEYHETLAKICVHDDFIYYEDISFVGEFVGYWGDGFRRNDTMRYEMKDESGNVVTIIIQKLHYPAKDIFDIGTQNPLVPMPERENYYYAPVESAEYPAHEVEYVVGDILYQYNALDESTGRSVIARVTWTYHDYLIEVYPKSLVTSAEGKYPDNVTDTFFGRLMDPDTAEGAMRQMNRAIFWREFRVAVKCAWPAVVCVVGIVAIGTVALVVWRKKKKVPVNKTAGPKGEDTR